MSKTMSFSLKIPDSTVGKLKNFCKEHGIKIGFFVEKAIMEKLERDELLEDSRDIIRLRQEESSAIPAEEYFAKRRI